MRKLLLLFALLIATVNASSAEDRFLKANVTGTVQTQTLITTSEERIHTSVLNNRRIFREFLVSSADYELAVNVAGGTELLLVPKHTGAMLPTLSVFKLGTNGQIVINTKSGLVRIVSDITSSDATNLFKDLAGEIDGTAQFRLPFPSSEVRI